MNRYVSPLCLFPILLFGKGIEDAKTYHLNSTMQWNVALDTIELIPWQGNENVLDIGCGDGKITALLSTKVQQGTLIGIDISQSMIDFASSLYPQNQYPNLAFMQMDAAEITFENQFDRVVSFSTLHWVLDQQKALNAFYKALVPGGYLCLHIYSKGPMNVTDIGDFLVRTEKWAAYFPGYVKQRIFFTEQEYKDLLQEAGFSQFNITGYWNETPLANRQAVFDLAKPVLNFIRHLPDDLQNEFVDEVVDSILSVAKQSDDGSILYTTFSLQIIGAK